MAAGPRPARPSPGPHRWPPGTRRPLAGKREQQMGQHPDPDPYEDEDLEALGTPVYEGSGLSVRALTADELQRFLDAHHGQPTRPLGSSWAALDPPPAPPPRGPRAPPPARVEAAGDPRPCRRPDWAPATRATRPSNSTGGAAARSWPPGSPA